MPAQSANPPELVTIEQWTAGLNQQDGRGAIGDQEQWWIENLFAIGPGNLRSCWGLIRDATTGIPTPIYTAPAGVKILRIFFGFIGDITPQNAAPPPGRYGWMFLSDGTIDQVELGTFPSDGPTAPVVAHTVVHVGGAGTVVWNPIAPQYWASAKVWRPRFIGAVEGQGGGVLFGSPADITAGTGGLYAWDGSILSAPGDPAPDWLTDALEVSPGVPFTMPTRSSLPGIYAMEVYNSRLFVAGKDVISFSAPSNGADFSTTDGGGSFGYFGDRLTYSFMDLAQTAGYLYVFGDSSTDVINNVQLSGGGTPESPFTTNLSYTNIDPQVGQRFPRPVGRIGRYLQTWNGAGIFETRGGEAREIGQKVTNIFNTLVVPASASDTTLYYPTMTTATMFGFRVLLCNGRFTDIYGLTRNLLLMWHARQGAEFWSIASQSLELTNIGSYEQDSIITPFGTDGDKLYQLFAAPDEHLLKILSTKFLRGQALQQLTIKNWKRLFLEFADNGVIDPATGNLVGRGVNFAGGFSTLGGGVPNGTQDVEFALAPGPVLGTGVSDTPRPSTLQPLPIQGAGIAGGIDIQSLSPDFTIERLHITSEERTLWGA